jgi:small multidrug resistance pump
VVVVGYGFSFYFFALTLKTIPTGVAYALWSGIGMVLIAILGLIIHHQKLDFAAVLGMSLIIAGVVIIQMFSKTLEG